MSPAVTAALRSGRGGPVHTDYDPGSLFELLPGTRYEVDLTRDDPDGGSTTETLAITTRNEPTIPADACERPVTPATLGAVLADAAPGDVPCARRRHVCGLLGRARDPRFTDGGQATMRPCAVRYIPRVSGIGKSSSVSLAGIRPSAVAW